MSASDRDELLIMIGRAREAYSHAWRLRRSRNLWRSLAVVAMTANGALTIAWITYWLERWT